MTQAPAELSGVTVKLKANIYFDGKVVSHTILSADGSRSTVGVIHPGEFSFNTDAPERMDILAGSCRVKLPGSSAWVSCAGGSTFHVPAKSRFEIAVDSGVAEYLCTFG